MFTTLTKSIISLLVMLPLAAFAKGESHSSGASSGGSEYFYQSAAGKQDVTPALALNSTNTKFKGGTKDKTSTTEVSGEYERGVMDGVSVGGKLTYTVSGTVDTGTSADKKGLNDLEAFAKATMPMGPGSLKYGGTLGINLADKETKTNGDQNTATGRMSLTPYVGYEYSMSPCIFGAKLSTEIGLGDGDVKTGSTTTTYSGHERTVVSLFYEHAFNADVSGGAALDWTTTSDTKPKTGAAIENLSPTQTLRLYAPYKLSKGVLLPELDYGFTTDDKVGTTDVDSYSQLNIKVGYRIEI